MSPHILGHIIGNSFGTLQENPPKRWVDKVQDKSQVRLQSQLGQTENTTRLLHGFCWPVAIAMSGQCFARAMVKCKNRWWTSRISMWARTKHPKSQRKLEEGKNPTPALSALLRKWSVLLGGVWVLTKDPKLLYYKTPPCIFCHKLFFIR